MKETAQRVALSTLIVIAIVAVALALWKLKLVLALIFLLALCQPCGHGRSRVRAHISTPAAKPGLAWS
jgi:hypothetical protein